MTWKKSSGRLSVLFMELKKESLGEAITDAMQKWILEKKQEKIAEEALKLLEQGFKFGKRMYKDRSELYER